ncbi:hypothetical protein A2769_00690 [Candidatus Daviesbacteria bacterium RIFCSPHIGHO2_01_FULL_37_27]|nr:MAG: hypothetical protein A2769_00690 [Candidatus Daviesbacteria bacterium RIFCSPHIGHO2_01_FULL_37_27]
MTTKNKFLKSYRSIFLIFLAAFIGGGIGALAKISLEEIPPLSFTLLRFLLAAFVLLPFVIKGKESFSVVSCFFEQNGGAVHFLISLGHGGIPPTPPFRHALARTDGISETPKPLCSFFALLAILTMWIGHSGGQFNVITIRRVRKQVLN